MNRSGIPSNIFRWVTLNFSTIAAMTSAIATAVLGLKWKQSVKAATTVAGTLATSFENGDTVDGIVLVTGDRILIKDQAAGAENGIYTVNVTGAPTRATDSDSGAELVNATVSVEQGTANADKTFVCTNNSITIGVTAIVFTGFAALSGALLAANNLSEVTPGTARTNLGLGELAVLNIAAIPYDLACQITGKPDADAVVLKFVATRAFTLSAAGQQGKAGTGADAQADFIVAVNGTTKATLRFAAAGTAISVVGGAAATIAAGDIITITAPAQDATLADIGFTLAGTLL